MEQVENDGVAFRLLRKTTLPVRWTQELRTGQMPVRVPFLSHPTATEEESEGLSTVHLVGEYFRG